MDVLHTQGGTLKKDPPIFVPVDLSQVNFRWVGSLYTRRQLSSSNLTTLIPFRSNEAPDKGSKQPPPPNPNPVVSVEFAGKPTLGQKAGDNSDRLFRAKDTSTAEL